MIEIVLPVYNEAGKLEGNLRRLAGRLEESGRAWRMVVVDDGSGDGSGAILDRLAGRWRD